VNKVIGDSDEDIDYHDVWKPNKENVKPQPIKHDSPQKVIQK